MKDIFITDKSDEMVRIGREIWNEKASVYDERMMSIIMSTINKNMKNVSKEEKEDALYQSIYDYWVYGNNIAEEFYFNFRTKTHDEKKKYITFRNRYLYYDYLNEKKDAHMLKDKYEAYQLLQPYYNREIIQIGGAEDYDIFCEFVEKHPEFVVKPTDLSLGIGVHKVCCVNYKDMKTLFNTILEEGINLNREYPWSRKPFVVLEEIIEQADELAAIHPYSVNGVRVTTVRIGDKVHIYFPWFKIGANKEFITSEPQGALMAGIDSNTGIVNTIGYTENGESFECHPLTNTRIQGYVIPRWQELVELCNTLSKLFPSIRYVGWDMALTQKGWCVIEGNDYGEFMWQLIYGRGMKKEFEELVGWKPSVDFWWKK